MTLKFLDEQCAGPCTPDELRRNMAAALEHGLPMVRKLDAHHRPLAIVGGGPSVSDDIEMLLEWQRDGTEVWACNGAFKWLAGHGVKADAFVMMDPHSVMAGYLDYTPDDVTYYVVSVADPAVFERLKGRNVILWHVSGKECPPPEGYGSVGGGPTIMCRAPMLAFCLGYREVHLFGADSSFDDGNHAYQALYGHNPAPRVKARLDGVEYETDIVMMHQVAYFQAIAAWFEERGARFEIHGRGLGPAMLKAKMHSVEEFDAA